MVNYFPKISWSTRISELTDHISQVDQDSKVARSTKSVVVENPEDKQGERRRSAHLVAIGELRLSRPDLGRQRRGVLVLLGPAAPSSPGVLAVHDVRQRRVRVGPDQARLSGAGVVRRDLNKDKKNDSD